MLSFTASIIKVLSRLNVFKDFKALFGIPKELISLCAINIGGFSYFSPSPNFESFLLANDRHVAASDPPHYY